MDEVAQDELCPGGYLILRTRRQSPAFATAAAKQASARRSASRCAAADTAIINSASPKRS
jgi:hypothetical protein